MKPCVVVEDVPSVNFVMAGQKREARLRARCPGHPRLFPSQDVDARGKPGHDELNCFADYF
jgi:hypothetical protein